jgi:AraC-like DNA-binding protein
MTETPPPMTALPDLLAGVLRQVHVASALFLRGEFSAPWALLSPSRADLIQVLQPGAHNLVLFHIVVEGRCHFALEAGDTAYAEAGEVVLLPYADRHSMAYPPSTPTVPIAELLPPPPWPPMPLLRHGGGGHGTRVLCGYLRCEELLFNPVLKALPPLIHLRPSAGAAQWLQASVHYALGELAQRAPGAGELLQRLPEVLLIDCLRQYAQQLPAQQKGFLAALRDPVAGRALALLHESPAHAWTIDELARRAATSRTVLGERFHDLLGESPMHYLTQWRLQLAARELSAGDVPVAAVANRVGYGSEAAFSRAFKRLLGVAPSAWRGAERSAYLG